MRVVYAHSTPLESRQEPSSIVRAWMERTMTAARFDTAVVEGAECRYGGATTQRFAWRHIAVAAGRTLDEEQGDTALADDCPGGSVPEMDPLWRSETALGERSGLHRGSSAGLAVDWTAEERRWAAGQA